MVELKKDLPEIFEEFADQRRNSFLAIKKLKEQGVPVVGAFCTYLPKELPRAMGAAVVGLCSVSDETIPDAEKDLPRNLCPLIKSSYGFAKTDKCPFFYFSDLVVGETTCDGKKKMYEMLAEFKPVYVIELPNRQSEEGIAMYRRCRRIADEIDADGRNVRLVLIAGPSSSGKTTFSQRLAVQMRVNGLRPIPISLDNYFKERENTPRLPDGSFDFESIEALDTELFNDHMERLLRDETVELPYFNFKTGHREYRGQKVLCL